MVTTITTMPASEPIDDGSSEERVESKAEEAGMRRARLLRPLHFVKRVSAHSVRNSLQLRDIVRLFWFNQMVAVRPVALGGLKLEGPLWTRR